MAEYDVFVPAGYFLEAENDDFDEIYTALIKAYAQGKLPPIQGGFKITRGGEIKFKNAPVKFEYKGDTYYINFETAYLLFGFADSVNYENCASIKTRRTKKVQVAKNV